MPAIPVLARKREEDGKFENFLKRFKVQLTTKMHKTLGPIPDTKTF